MAEDAPGHEDEPPGQGEGVDDRVVDNLEGPREAGFLRSCGQCLADIVHILLQPGVIVEANGAFDLLRALPPHVDLRPFADEDELTLAGGRVHGTADEGRGCESHDGKRPESLAGGDHRQLPRCCLKRFAVARKLAIVREMVVYSFLFVPATVPGAPRCGPDKRSAWSSPCSGCPNRRPRSGSSWMPASLPGQGPRCNGWSRCR